MNVNKVTLVGRLTADPEVRSTPTGQTVTNFSLATTTSWKDQGGEKKEKTEFHNIVAWAKRGEVIGQYCVKGQELYVEGRLETRNWDDKDSGKKMYRTEVLLENFEFGQKPGGATGSPSQPPKPAAQSAATSTATKVAAPAAAAGAVAASEEIPTINLEDEDEVKIEDVPF